MKTVFFFAVMLSWIFASIISIGEYFFKSFTKASFAYVILNYYVLMTFCFCHFYAKKMLLSVTIINSTLRRIIIPSSIIDYYLKEKLLKRNGSINWKTWIQSSYPIFGNLQKIITATVCWKRKRLVYEFIELFDNFYDDDGQQTFLIQMNFSLNKTVLILFLKIFKKKLQKLFVKNVRGDWVLWYFSKFRWRGWPKNFNTDGLLIKQNRSHSILGNLQKEITVRWNGNRLGYEFIKWYGISLIYIISLTTLSSKNFNTDRLLIELNRS